jgi:hypothetical protein
MAVVFGDVQDRLSFLPHSSRDLAVASFATKAYKLLRLATNSAVAGSFMLDPRGTCRLGTRYRSGKPCGE